MSFKEFVHELLFPRPSQDIATLTAPSESEPTSRIADLSKAATLIEARSVRPEPHTTGRIPVAQQPKKCWYKSQWTRVTVLELLNQTIQHVHDIYGVKYLPRVVYLAQEQYEQYLLKTREPVFRVGRINIRLEGDFEAPCSLRNNQSFVVGIQEAK